MDTEEQEMEIEDYQPDPNLQKEIEEYTDKLDNFKYELYTQIVQKDNSHSANSIDPLYNYHAFYLQCIGFWIGVLDHGNLSLPYSTNTSIKKYQDDLTALTLKFKEQSTDARILAYSVLMKKSTEHPYIFPSNL